MNTFLLLAGAKISFKAQNFLITFFKFSKVSRARNKSLIYVLLHKESEFSRHIAQQSVRSAVNLHDVCSKFLPSLTLILFHDLHRRCCLTTREANSKPGKASSSPDMNQQCKVCGEPAAGFHFGAFTCEGCKVSLLFFSLSTIL